MIVINLEQIERVKSHGVSWCELVTKGYQSEISSNNTLLYTTQWDFVFVSIIHSCYAYLPEPGIQTNYFKV